MSKYDKLSERVEKLEENTFVSWWENDGCGNYHHLTPVNMVIQAILDYLEIELGMTPAQMSQIIAKKKQKPSM